MFVPQITINMSKTFNNIELYSSCFVGHLIILWDTEKGVKTGNFDVVKDTFLGGGKHNLCYIILLFYWIQFPLTDDVDNFCLSVETEVA